MPVNMPKLDTYHYSLLKIDFKLIKIFLSSANIFITDR